MHKAMNRTIHTNELISRYQEPLYWHIRRLVVNHEDARDLLQDTFLQAFRSMDQLREQKAAKSWLYRIATNLCYRHLQRNRIVPLSTEELSAHLLEQLEASSYVDFERDAELRFQQALLRLSEQQRTVFTLRYYDEMSYDEIAQIVDSTPGSLRVSYHQAVERIKSILRTEHEI